MEHLLSDHTKLQSLENILLKLGPITDVHFEPFQCEPKQVAKALLPSSFPRSPQPFDYFTLFFTPHLFETITINTNRYANIQRLSTESADNQARLWTDLLVEELYVFIGVIIYMGVHEEPQIPMYWNTDFNKGPLYSIPNHILLNRFQQIKRFCHIFCPENDKKEGYHLSSNKI